MCSHFHHVLCSRTQWFTITQGFGGHASFVVHRMTFCLDFWSSCVTALQPLSAWTKLNANAVSCLVTHSVPSAAPEFTHCSAEAEAWRVSDCVSKDYTWHRILGRSFCRHLMSGHVCHVRSLRHHLLEWKWIQSLNLLQRVAERTNRNKSCCRSTSCPRVSSMSKESSDSKQFTGKS